MAVNVEYRDYILDLLEPLGEVSAKRFFGGIGLYFDSKQFAMIMGSVLYFCVDDASREKYVEAGSEPFSYSTKKGRVIVKRYYETPEGVLEDGEELVAWAAEAVEVARGS